MTLQTTRDREEREVAPAVEHALSRSARRAMVAIYTGLVVTVVAIVALARYLASTDGLAEHLDEVYEGYASPPDEAGVAAYLFTLGALGVLGRLWMLWAVAGQKRWARPVATVLFLLASVVALANLTVTEYGQTILPTLDRARWPPALRRRPRRRRPAVAALTNQDTGAGVRLAGHARTAPTALTALTAGAVRLGGRRRSGGRRSRGPRRSR
jgi:hypothetical protein